MSEDEFSNIFIRPLHKDIFPLSEIDKNIYDEVIDLTNRFCIPSQVLKNLIYDEKIKNPLIDSLSEQMLIANLKKLINQKELLKIANLFNLNSIEYVFMKGSAINALNDEYVRYSRDIDILVCKKSLLMAYELLKEIGYGYLNPLVSDSSKFTNKIHHLPVLTNGEGALVELHHRVTKKLIYSECPLTDLMLKQPLIINKNNVDIKITNINHTIAHLTYHAFLHHGFALGPVFLYDIKYLLGLRKDDGGLTNLLNKMGLKEDYREVIKFIDKEIMIDSFKIYKVQKIKIYDQKNPKKFSYLLFTKKGRLDFWNTIKTAFMFYEDYFQTSKYSLKFYLILLKTLKRHIGRLSKN